MNQQYPNQGKKVVRTSDYGPQGLPTDPPLTYSEKQDRILNEVSPAEQDTEEEKAEREEVESRDHTLFHLKKIELKFKASSINRPNKSKYSI